MKTINQKDYGLIEIDDSESDIVQISNSQIGFGGLKNFELIQIERENLQELINELEKCLTTK